MPAVTTELRVQAGKQTVWTTGVAPTVALRGVTGCKIKPDQEIQVLSDMQLGLAGGDSPFVARNGGGGSADGWATYEDLAYWLDAMMGEATPGAGPGYLRSYAAPIATLPTPRILSLVHGEANVGAYRLVGGIVNSFTLKLEVGKELTFNAELIGSAVDATTVSGVLSTRTVTPIVSGDVATVFLDNWAGTMGATALTKCFLRSMTLTVNANRQNRYCIGSLSAADYLTKTWDGMLDVMLEWNSTSKAVIDAMVGGAASKQQIELNFSGGTNKTLKLQFAGTVNESPDIFVDDDGVVAVGLKLKNTYHPTFANWLKIALASATATLA
jgi:hypothetical protein